MIQSSTHRVFKDIITSKDVLFVCSFGAKRVYQQNGRVEAPAAKSVPVGKR
jgi:hypothetical protein